jgi:hypothetical protein
MHHVYKAFVKVAGKDIEVESFDSEEKGVSPYSYTDWEFDLTAHSGTAQLSIAIGIATTDSDSTVSIAWVKVPVKHLVVIK